MDRISQITSSDLLSSLCKSLLAAEYKDFQTIDDSGGDAGNDGYSESQQILFQFYCPEKPEKADDANYKSKIFADLEKAKKLIDSNKYAIREWIFITPRELREPVQTYIRMEAAARGFVGIAWASPKLIELLSKHNHLRSQFPDLIQPDIEKQLEATANQILEHIDAVDEVEKKFKTKLELTYQRRIDHAKEKLDQGKCETAKKEYELILNDLSVETEAMDPHIYFRVYNNLGVCELNLGNHSEAAKLFENAYLSEPDLPMAGAKHALSKLFNGKPEEGLRIIENVLEKYPDDDHAISVRGSILYELKQFSVLIPFMRDKGKIAAAHWYQGWEHISQGDYNKAVSSFESVVRLEPENVQALQLIAQNIMLDLQEFNKNSPYPPDRIPENIKEKFGKAISSLKQSLQLLKNVEQKNDVETAYVNLTGCYLAIGSYQESIEAAAEAVSINPNSFVPFLNKGIAQLKLGHFEEAISSFRTYKELGGEEDVDRHIGFCSLRTGGLDTAAEIISRLLETGTGLDLDIAELAVDLYSRKLDNEKLNSLLERLEKEFPNNPQALRMRAQYLLKRGMDGAESLIIKAQENARSESEKMMAEIDLADLRFSSKEFGAAAEIYRKYSSTQEANYYTVRYAESFYNSGQYGALLAWIETLSLKVREHSTVQQVEAFANMYLGNLEKSAHLLKALFEKHPNDLQYLVTYGMCQYRLSKFETAKAAYDAIKNRITETADLITLAGGYQLIGESDMAIELSYKALENDPNNAKTHLAFISIFLKREQAEGRQPEEKHIKAFQKSMAEFNTRFPEETALQRLEVKDGDFSGFFKMIDQVAAAADNAMNLYKESQAPLAIVPRMTGKRPLDVWGAFTQIPEVGIKISFGTPDEFNTELSVIDKYRDKYIVIDIYPLFLLAHFDKLELLPKLFKKIYVHQSVLDEITETIEDRKISVRAGVSFIGKIDGHHRITDVSPDQVKKTLSLLEKLRSFITTNTFVEIKGLSKEKSIEEKNFINALHESTRDSIFLSQDLNISLLCDDRLLREILLRDFKQASFSLQTLFFAASKHKIISLEEFSSLQNGMIDLNYDFITINGAFLYRRLQNANYQISELDKLISTSVKKKTSTQSLSVVLADLLLLLMIDQGISTETKYGIFGYILEQASSNHDLTKLEEGIFMILQTRVPPEVHNQLRDFVKLVFSEYGNEKTKHDSG